MSHELPVNQHAPFFLGGGGGNNKSHMTLCETLDIVLEKFSLANLFGQISCKCKCNNFLR